MTDQLVHAIARLVDVLPGHDVRMLLAAVARHRSAVLCPRQDLEETVGGPRARALVARLHDAWRTAPSTVSGMQLASMLHAALETAERVARRHPEVELVWTGPTTPHGVPVRLTREVFREVVQAARTQLTVVSFAAYKDQLIAEELGAAADRGIDVRLVLESPHAKGGVASGDPAGTFEALRAKVTFYVWPPGQRPQPPHGIAAMHAKALVADDYIAFISSANLTGHALTQNMELGVKVTGGDLPAALQQHLSQLIAHGVLVSVDASLDGQEQASH